MVNRISPFLFLCRRAVSFGLLVSTAVLLLCSCGTPTVRVEVPPRVDLNTWPVIGLIDFTTNADPALARDATEKFIQNLSSAQPGTRLLELGSMAQVLEEVQRSKCDPVTIKAIGAHYGVDAVLTGHLDITEMSPDINLSPTNKTFSAAARVNSDLSAKLQETASGATLWSNGAHGQWSLGGVRYNGGGLADFHYDDPNDQYRKMILDLAAVATNDFRPTYQNRPVTE